ncbi:cobalamin biosynthesis protein [Mycobacterium ulcerans]|uniref:Cobalamin biosynthesis protein CobD n=2 Tax=Mycobacterium ulcerans TaxID=1809 RepID=A0PNF6_MYCUA|nr:cobalamin biosynthesis protein [Mycobacterium ulcerans]ABL03875.1 cobalamin biosynthesis transmembrane protein CobD [Mycobacterium ulcerans Agy99]MEB3903648.1 cobalamin biosynthesis protein [Mycobacterium ulcerans]MEB3907788.1 cobalamin biosynthesis protein [Mycobacterium ulcerans]MEB3918086.1 cobalamin biosynthesis protein [Mycobacterium ulcerans]MEB3922215.1 cobalamin biosynthesis protein [Mycobacterium ulcerans]
MVASARQARTVGVLVGYLADLVLGDPQRGHPVAVFGRLAAGLERASYRDTRAAGAVHVGVLVGGVGLLGAVLGRPAGRPWSVAATAMATWVSLGGTSLVRTGREMAELLDRGDLDAARRLLPSLCGRDPAQLDVPDLTRAALESVAENTSDAQVAPLLWAAVGGVPAVLVYRAVNTLDAMIGYRSPRYLRFGWAAARLDDLANYFGARVTAGLVVLCAPLVGGSALGAVRAWRRDAARHPSPNAGVVEAAFAGALRVRLGGPTRYHFELQIRPTLGDGGQPTVDDLRRAVTLSRAVQAAAGVGAGLFVYRRRP